MKIIITIEPTGASLPEILQKLWAVEGVTDVCAYAYAYVHPAHQIPKGVTTVDGTRFVETDFEDAELRVLGLGEKTSEIVQFVDRKIERMDEKALRWWRVNKPRIELIIKNFH